MKYYHNKNYGIILYPENWFDTFRCFLTWVIHPSFIRTWRNNPYWKTRAHVAGCIERKLTQTDYPDECAAG